MKANKVKWGLVDKARNTEQEITKNRANELRDRLKELYGLDTTPSSKITAKEKEKKDRRQQGFSASTAKYYRRRG